MNNHSVNELLRVLNEIAADVQDTKLKIDALESALKGEAPEAYSQYQKMLGAYRNANQIRSIALAEGSGYGTLRSALSSDQKAAEQKPSDQKASDQKPFDEKPSAQESSDQKASDEKPSDQKPKE
jgi:hypothetical protein